jgi:hypothetical protein
MMLTCYDELRSAPAVQYVGRHSSSVHSLKIVRQADTSLAIAAAI